MIEIQENIDIKPYTTMKIGGRFKYFAKVYDINDMKEIISFSKEKKIPIFILGGGSNIIFSDNILNILAVKMEIRGVDMIKDDNNFVEIKVGAGENLDNFIKWTVENNLSGMEALSAIPGTVGATPIQNVGAYGSEVKDVILVVEVFDLKRHNIKSISNKKCKFGYRDSIFKGKAHNKYVIISVTFKLSKGEPVIPQYNDVIKYFSDKNIENPNGEQIRQAIIEIRSFKLPDWSNKPNVGSFFKNPIISKKLAEKIKVRFPTVKMFKVGRNKIKIPAGWLIENSGLKGISLGKISVYDKNSLVLINNSDATLEDLVKAKNEIIKKVKNDFGITLEQEPQIVN